MNPRTRVLALTLGGLLAASHTAHASFVTSGSYDENTTEPNSVDRSATFVGGTGGATAANIVDVTTFTGLMNTAFAIGAGGVVDFESGAFPGGQGPIEGTFDGGAKTFSLSGPDDFVLNNSTSTGRLPISGTNMITQFGSNNNGFQIDTISLSGALAPGEAITYLGLSLLDKTEGSNVTASFTVTFSGGGTVTASSDDYLGIGSGEDNNDDIFFGFVAPAGESIVSLTSFTPGTFVNLDDIAVITNAVPEPASLVLLGLGGLCLASRRSRR